MPYVVQIHPDHRLRILPQVCCILLYAIGAVLLLVVAIDTLPKLLLIAICFACARKEWIRQERGYGRVESIRIHEDGRLECVAYSGTVEPVRLLGGSMVLPRHAWLRMQFADGSHYGELLSGDPDTHPDWHGLQLIRMQCGVHFGRTDRS
jgi:hypothetical protein